MTTLLASNLPTLAVLGGFLGEWRSAKERHTAPKLMSHAVLVTNTAFQAHPYFHTRINDSWVGHKYSGLGEWLREVIVAILDESQQYVGYHEVASLVAIHQPILAIFTGDHRQTPGSLSKSLQP